LHKCSLSLSRLRRYDLDEQSCTRESSMDRQPMEVVTAYRTSKIEKYWGDET
jgi:hypothetical protein